MSCDLAEGTYSIVIIRHWRNLQSRHTLLTTSRRRKELEFKKGTGCKQHSKHSLAIYGSRDSTKLWKTGFWNSTGKKGRFGSFFRICGLWALLSESFQKGGVSETMERYLNQLISY